MAFKDAIGTEWPDEQKAAAYLVVASVLDGWMVAPKEGTDIRGRKKNSLSISKIVVNQDGDKFKPVSFSVRTNNAIYKFELENGYRAICYYAGLDPEEYLESEGKEVLPMEGKKICEALMQKAVSSQNIGAVGLASSKRNEIFMMDDEMLDKSGFDAKLLEEINKTIEQNTASAYDEIGSSLQ